MTVAILKKISAKALVGDVKKIVKDAKQGDTIWLMRVGGIAKGLRTGESNYGPWTAILGDFLVTAFVGDKAGKDFRSGQIFLPEVVENMVAPAVENLGKGESVVFAFDVGVMADESATTGYVYTASFAREPEANDPLQLMAKELKALPAPSNSTATDEAKETSKK